MRVLSIGLCLSVLSCNEPNVVVKLPKCVPGENSIIHICDDKEDDQGLRTCRGYDLCETQSISKDLLQDRVAGFCIDDDSMAKLIAFIRAAYEHAVEVLNDIWDRTWRNA